jgi:hypothetical protein
MRKLVLLTITVLLTVGYFSLGSHSTSLKTGSVHAPKPPLLAAAPGAIGKPLMAQLASGSSCTDVPNGSCVETRSGLSLCMLNNVCIVKVDLNNASIRPRVVIAPNGGTDWLSQLATSAGAIAAINGDYFSGCPDGTSPPNCGEGLTFVDGVDYTDYTGNEWQVRRSLGFNDNYDPNIGWHSEQGGYHRQAIGGGPQVTFNGEYRWRCWYQDYNTDGDCSCDGTTVVINAEQFACSADNWWNRPQSFIGYSEDGNTLFFAKSVPGYNKTPHEMHDVLWALGARNTLKLDGGGSSGTYFEDGGYSFSWDGSRSIANAWVIMPEGGEPPPPATGNWEARYDQGDTCWWDPDCHMNPRCTETISGPELHKDWGSNAPCGDMNPDDWIVDLNGTVYFPPGEYVPYLDHDDGAKLWLNGERVIERSSSGSGPVCNGQGGYVLSGDEPVRVILREQGGDAHLHLTWSSDTSVCASPPSCEPNSDQVALFAGTDFSGGCETLDIGQYPNPGHLGSVGNDNVESVKVGSNVQALLCEHDDYQGQCETFTADDGNLGDNPIGADRVSSVQVQYPSPTPTPTPVPTSMPTPTPTPTPTATPISRFGGGADGPQVVTGTHYVDDGRAAVSSTAGGGQREVQVSSTSGFTVGQEVLIIQMAGTGAGSYESGIIASAGSGVLTLASDLGRTYTVGGNSKAQVLRVPHYQDVTVLGTLTAHPWNGSTGGIVAFRVAGTLTVEASGRIDLTGLGFPGGPGGNEYPGSYPDTGSTGGSYISSLPLNGPTGDDCGGCISPAGSGNGGGGHGGRGSRGTDGASGGGGASYGSPGNAGQAAPVSPWASGGQPGSIYGTEDLSTIYMGSGGGGGGKGKDGYGAAGENGGGIVIIYADTLVLYGGIYANGKSGLSNASGNGGGGGGGAGGSILLVVRTATLGTDRVSATGGGGGNGNLGGNGSAGGNGGAGRIRIEYSESLSGSTNPQASVQQFGSPPQPSFTVSPISGDTCTLFVLDASACNDDEDPQDSLEVCWDWENDSICDTGWSTNKVITHTYAFSGTYTPRLQVRDTEGLTSSTTRSVTVSDCTGVVTYTELLPPGWIPFSFPLHLMDPDPASVLSSIAGGYDLVFIYVGCDQVDPWRKLDPNAPPFASDLTELNETMGIWIHMLVTDTLVVTGTVPITGNVSLCEGWNFIGSPSLQTRPIAEALASVEGKYVLVYAYDPSDAPDPWKKYDPGAPPYANDLNEMKPGWGYWIKVNEDCTWTLTD